ncbi:hypothetical protein OG474_27490 [Kribbella sp. NBC_01505]|uniref:hypothetical protein n=1 Tax=Kribbella sp. NBC_01505 TaxID=2903580 RepID=UPI00386E2A14
MSPTLAGIAFLAHGLYLAFVFQGESYWMFFQAFFLPAILVVTFVRSLFVRRSQRPRVSKY